MKELTELAKKLVEAQIDALVYTLAQYVSDKAKEGKVEEVMQKLLECVTPCDHKFDEPNFGGFIYKKALNKTAGDFGLLSDQQVEMIMNCLCEVSAGQPHQKGCPFYKEEEPEIALPNKYSSRVRSVVHLEEAVLVIDRLTQVIRDMEEARDALFKEIQEGKIWAYRHLKKDLLRKIAAIGSKEGK